jgi:hypothetical protein
VAVGQGTNTLAYSFNGITWTGLGTSIFTTQGTSVSWNGSYFLATGEGTNTVATSIDGISWTGLGAVFSLRGNGAMWNGYVWVAVGQGTDTIEYSLDGTTWIGLGTSIFSVSGACVNWNGRLWVAVGQGTNTIATSVNGINWIGRGTTVFAVTGTSVAWNGIVWVATGVGTNTLAYSWDGITWVGLTTTVFLTAGQGVTWNGRIFIAAGQGTNNLAWSSNGVNWNGVTGTSLFGNTGFALGFSSNTQPSFRNEFLDIFPQGILLPYRSTNQILTLQSSMILNNTLCIDNTFFRVGINCNSPSYDLDVNGAVKMSTLTLGSFSSFSTIGPAASNIRLAVLQGDAYKPTGTTWNITSDQRIKENIVDADYEWCYNDIKTLRLRRFTYAQRFIDEAQVYDRRVLGFIAQEVSTIFPKAVSQGPGFGYPDLYSLNVDQINMAAFGALKKVMVDKENLQSTLLSLETLNTQILGQLSTIESRVSSCLGGNV